MSERYIYAVYRQPIGEKPQLVATRLSDGFIEGGPLPDPILQRLDACARVRDEGHEFLWSQPDPRMPDDVNAMRRDTWVFERQKEPAPKPEAKSKDAPKPESVK